MIGSFFLPWVQLFGMSGSGYELSKFGSYGNLAWVIPIAAVVTLVTSLAGNDAKRPHIVTGLLPYAGLAYGLSQIGKELFHVLAIGVYLTLVAGVLMVLFAAGVLGAKAVSVVNGVTAESTNSGSPSPSLSNTNSLPILVAIGLAVLAAIAYGGYSYIQNQREQERVQAEKRVQEEHARQQERERIRRQQEWQGQQQLEQAQRQKQIEEQRRTEENRNLFQIARDAFRKKQYDDGLPPLRKSAERGYAPAQNSLAWFYATSPEPRYLDAASAVRFAEYAVQQEFSNWAYLDTLAAAYARSGDFAKAVHIQEQAINFLRENFQMSSRDREQALEAAKQRRALYSARQAYNEH
jgi:Tfp pilus assembly protein PilE/uncharacterized membrane protein YecN with MAPEG domain